ncbi:CDP-alcohol phosphatidyltransferase family protein [Candidatus Saccharibacteria bacterium]|nr:CDP-alcohol phosphatidyltransferase family protein [Candidatus Saccharibacteria bacterium]
MATRSQLVKDKGIKRWKPECGEATSMFQMWAWSPADWVSVMRGLVLAPMVMIIVWATDAAWQWWWLVWLIIGATDKLDGVLARRLGKSRFGETIDEQADKICILLGFAIIGVMGLVSWMFLVPMVAREVLVTLLRVRMRDKGSNVINSAAWMGKAKAVGQYLLVGVAIMPTTSWQGSLVLSVAAVTLTLSVVSGLQYAVAAVRWKPVE